VIRMPLRNGRRERTSGKAAGSSDDRAECRDLERDADRRLQRVADLVATFTYNYDDDEDIFIFLDYFLISLII